MLKKKADQKKIIVPNGEAIIHISATSNNTIITITDNNNHLLVNASGGKAIGDIPKFNNAKKGLSYVAHQKMLECVKIITEKYGIHTVRVRVKNIGPGRAAALNALNSKDQKLNIIEFMDVTPIPHNGCRAPKRQKK
jgi:small subunit ribosomal protein S11